MPYELNAINRGMYIADNLEFLKALNDECIDLVCIDPPFKKNETFGRKNSKGKDPLKPPLTDQERQVELDLLARWGIHGPDEADTAGINWPETAYKDFWSWEKDVHEDWLTSTPEKIQWLIESTRYVHGDDTAAYLCYMAVRLFEVKRVLKDTGSLYLHCDHTANAYLRQLLDAIFGNGEDGKPGFRNEIIWKRSPGRSSGKHWGNTTDTILFYSKCRNYTWEDTRQPSTNYKVTSVPLDAEGTRNGKSGQPWRGYNPTDIGRHWAVPISGSLAKWINENAIPGYSGIDDPHERLDALASVGLISWSNNGRPSIPRPPSADAGNKVNNSWWDIKLLSSTSNERTGYPTQKPMALAERIIKASCPDGGVVLDCFAGCAYVAVAAERLGRNWIACDINPRAWTVFKRQFSKPKLALLDCAEPVDTGVLIGNVATVYGPGELPVRTSPDHEDMPDTFNLPERKFKVPSSIFTNQEMLAYLLPLSNWQAWCCGFANRLSDGSIIPTTRNFHLDHVDPKSKEGSNEIYNRAPLCPYHNTRKGNQRLHLDDYRKVIADAGEMMVDSISELRNLAELRETVQRYWALEYAKRNPQQPLAV